jgi:hypothetical protein
MRTIVICAVGISGILSVLVIVGNTTSIEWSDEWIRLFPVIVYRRGLFQDLII